MLWFPSTSQVSWSALLHSKWAHCYLKLDTQHENSSIKACGLWKWHSGAWIWAIWNPSKTEMLLPSNAKPRHFHFTPLASIYNDLGKWQCSSCKFKAQKSLNSIPDFIMTKLQNSLPTTAHTKVYNIFRGLLLVMCLNCPLICVALILCFSNKAHQVKSIEGKYIHGCYLTTLTL